MTQEDRIRTEAHRLGFDLIGFTTAEPPSRAAAYRSWIEQGLHGEMSWLARDPERRSDPGRALPGARSIIVVGLSYFADDPPPEIWNDPLRGRIARYAWGRDYHDEMIPMLKELVAFLDRDLQGRANFRTYVDTGPVLERELAERAGLGFVGKNTLLIHERLGSYLFLGEILTDLVLEPDARRPEEERGTCGACRRCQEACPTHAFPAPYVLDSRLCLSYLTIELKGAIPVALRPKLKNWIYGCDECQTVCPWVRRHATPRAHRFLRWDPDASAPSLLELMALDARGFRDRFQGTPMMRTKRRGLLRNVAVALGNSGRPEAVPVLERALTDEEPLIREHAGWALQRLNNEVGGESKDA